MRVELTETQRQLRDTVRAFAQARVRPEAASIDREERFPTELIAELGRMGVLGCFVPERFGGAGFDYVAYALAVEELSAASAATGAIVAAHASLATWPILALGTDAQREQYLPRLARGEWLGCCALSEPGGASDAGGVRTTARRDGSHYVLNGRKSFVTNGPSSSLAIVFATLDAAKGEQGVAAFIVETAWPGWQVLDVEETMGMCGARSARLAFTDLRVPAANLLTSEDGGARVARKTLDGAWIAIAAQAVGIARAAYEASLVYAGDRRAFGKRLADFQAMQFRLADMACGVEAARLLTLHAAWLADGRLPHAKEAAMAKLYAAETAMSVATQAVQVHGGYGYTREFPVERHFRDAKSTEISGGPSESQQLVIATQLLREAHGQ